MAETKSPPALSPDESKQESARSDSPHVQPDSPMKVVDEEPTEVGEENVEEEDEEDASNVIKQEEVIIEEEEDVPNVPEDESAPGTPDVTPEEPEEPESGESPGEATAVKEEENDAVPVVVETEKIVDVAENDGVETMPTKQDDAVGCHSESKPVVPPSSVAVAAAPIEGRKRSKDHGRRSRSSSSSSINSSGSSSSSSHAGHSTSPEGNSSSSHSESEGVSAAKKVKLETQRTDDREEIRGEEQQQTTVSSPAPRTPVNGEEEDSDKSVPAVKEDKSSVTGRTEADAKETRVCSPPSPPPAVPATPPPKRARSKEKQTKMNPVKVEVKAGGTMLLSAPPSQPSLPPPPTVARPGESEIPRPVGKLPVVAPVIEKPDSARLTADLQSCQRQLAEVRSKYDVTRKELHATKRKLKRLTVRMSAATSSAGGGGATVGGNASPHAPAVSAPDEDRNRKWREPMIQAAMKIKTAMGIQAYKSLIKDGELLLPSLRTITRYLESLRKAGGGAAAAAAALVAAGAPASTHKPANHSMVMDEMLDEEEDDEDDDGDEHEVVTGSRPLEQQGVRRKQVKANGGSAARTVDHNRNEQRRHISFSAQHQHPQLPEIKTEHDPVNFTASPDINYYQHNANDDDEEDEDGYQDPTSLLEGCRYATADGMQINGDDGSYQYSQQGQQQQQQQQTLSHAQIEFLKSMVGFRKKWTPYELRTCNDIRRIIGSREYDSLRKNDGMPLPSVKTLRKYRHAAQLPDGVDVMGRKRKHNEIDDSPPAKQSVEASRYASGEPVGGDGSTRVLFPFGNDSDKEMLKPVHDPDGGHFDVSMLTLPQISFLQTLTMNTKGFSDYELQRSLELKNELGSDNYETLRKQEFLNIPTLAMLTRYEQDNGLEDLSRLGKRSSGESRRREEDANAIELTHDQEEQRARELEERQAREQQQQEHDQEQQRQLELYNRLTQADPTRHPLFDSIAGDASPTDGSDTVATAAAFAAAMAAAAAAGLHLDQLNGGSVGAGGDDSSMSIFEHHSIFDKDTPTFDMSKLSPAHVEFLNTLPENPKRWTQEMINSALDIKNEIGTRDYEILRRQGIPLPAARTLRRHKDIRNKADRALSETGEILSTGGGGVTSAGVV